MSDEYQHLLQQQAVVSTAGIPMRMMLNFVMNEYFNVMVMIFYCFFQQVKKTRMQCDRLQVFVSSHLPLHTEESATSD